VVGLTLAVTSGLVYPMMRAENGSAGPTTIQADRADPVAAVPDALGPRPSLVDNAMAGAQLAADRERKRRAKADRDAGQDAPEDAEERAQRGPSAPQASLTGFPNASNTGWKHTGVTLTPYAGPETITEDGAVIDGKSIDKCLWVRAQDVVIKRSRIRCGGHFAVRVEEDARVTIEDTEIDGRGSSGTLCIAFQNYTAVRVDCHGVGDGLRVGSKVSVVDSYIHGLVGCSGCHNDAIQSTGGSDIVLRHNTIENPFKQTACIKLGNEQGALRRVLVEDNLLNGGGYTVYGGGTDSNVQSIKFLNNRFRRAPAGFFSDGGHYGPVSYFDSGLSGNEWSGNVWDDNGSTVRPE
jgi:hypothetical protein